MRTLLARFRDWFRRRSLEADFDAEMRFHLEQLEEDLRGRGMSPAEARLAARREFGNATRAREDLRERAGFPLVDEFFRDLRHAWRGLRRRPMLACGVVLVLCIGLGGAGTLASLTRAVLFAPLPVPEADELHLVVAPERAEPERLSYQSVRRLDTLLEGGSAAGYSGNGSFNVRREGQPLQRARGQLVTGNFFGLLGLEPLAGRLLTPADDAPGAPAVAVASHAWALQAFGTAQAAIGQEVWVNQQLVAIVGVLPARFQAITFGQHSDLWLPASLQKPVHYAGNAWIFSNDDRPNDPDWTREERVKWMTALLRLPPRARPSAAAALEEAVKPQREQFILAVQDPAEREAIAHERLAVVQAPGGFSPVRTAFRPLSMLLAGLVATVLVVACANVSGLLLVRTLSRHRELGVRLALGSGRWRIARLGIAESLILCAGGALAGWILSLLLFPGLSHLLMAGRDLHDGLLEPGQLAIMGGLTLLCAAMCGVGPALLIARMEPLGALAGHGGLQGAAGRLGRWLVTAQLALAVLLVAVAATLGTEIARTIAADPGYARETVLSTDFDPRAGGYDRAGNAALVERLDGALRAVPGVVDVGFAFSGILNGSVSTSAVTFRDPLARIHAEHIQGEVVRPGYFAVTGMALLAGRDLSPDDRADSPNVAVINAALARRVFGDRDPIGQRFGFDTTPTESDFTIVGVVADAKVNSVRGPAPAVFYRCAAQSPDADLRFIAVRVAGSPDAARQAARAALARSEPGLLFSTWRTLQERIVDDLGPSRAATRIATSFATIAIILASAGVAASLGYLVALRQRELALRIALGADPAQIRRGVLRDALKLGAAGAAIGLALAWSLPLIPAVASRLPASPDLFVGTVAAAVGLCATVAAGWAPARRAARADLLMLLKLD